MAVAAKTVARYPNIFLWLSSWPPYIWLSAIWALTCAFAAARIKRPFAQVALLSLVGVFFVLGVYEAYLFSRIVAGGGDKVFVVTDAAGNPVKVDAPHDILGYAPLPGKSVHVVLTHEENTIYRYGFTIGPDGLRIPPPHRPGADVPCALFFGGSFTFGTAVEDDEALPYVAGILSGGKYRVHNFEYTGYGPHQMLAALENGLVDSIIECVPEIVIYQAMPVHSLRAAGRAGWDTHGPRYMLADTGEAVRHGNFDDVDSSLLSLVLKNLEKSLVLTTLGYNRYTQHKTDLMVAIMDGARSLAAERYPGSDFHVILWDGCSTIAPEPIDRYLAGGIARKGFRLHLVTQIVKDICTKRDEYMIRGDVYPNKIAHDRIARYVVKEIFRD